ncbi:morphogenesis protein [Aspergillus sclerotialis]|uniref:Morphogenesis protein n=1 Tax=Aspergillus sclerotialis TaxID=2070753 RepID=A0A3A2ZSK3_9EURO|nr:morphogenesis protein [Aspergillus sclerotialis]
MPFFTRVFRSKDSNSTKKNAKPAVVQDPGPPKPSWSDAWLRSEIAPDEVQDLLRGCTLELKARALDTPFLLIPFRPSSDPSASRTFIRNYFNNSFKKGSPIAGDELMQELRLTDPMVRTLCHLPADLVSNRSRIQVLCSVMKWCWSRLPGGVVTWEAYQLFREGEQDSGLARDAFSTFIPISADSDSRTKIIFDFFDLLAAIAAHGKSNGLGGRKLSRYAGWWAFEHTDEGKGFDAAYKNWAAAADATSHLFFAYLRSVSPDLPRGLSGISSLPIALQSLVQATEYPPEAPSLLQVSTTKVVMIVDTVSPTPFALLRRAKNFEYRDSDHHLQQFSSFEDPIQALTDECTRVLKCISSANQSSVSSSKTSTSLRDASWSRFEDIGFGGAIESDFDDEEWGRMGGARDGPRSTPLSSGGHLERPTTPSWADFMSSGFSDENPLKAPPAPLLLPPDKVLPPPLPTDRGQSSQSHRQTLETESSLEPGELASITTLDLDDSFWWVWVSSLAGEEPAARKAVFGRCTLVETIIKNAKWLILEEQVKGAAPEPEPGAYLVEKKRFFSFSSRKGKLTRRKSSAKKMESMEDSYKRNNNPAPQSKTSIAPDQHARIQAAAAALQRKHREQEQEFANGSAPNNRSDTHSKTNSVMTLQPAIMSEASQAMKWASNYDKNAYRTAYLSDNRAGTGAPSETLKMPTNDKPGSSLSSAPSTSTRQAPQSQSDAAPTTPKENTESVLDITGKEENSNPAPPPAEVPPRKPVESPEDATKKLKKKQGNTGIKSMFGTGRKKAEQPPMKPTGAEPSAVAAARAALEGKAKAAQEQQSRSVPATNGSSVLKKKPLPESPTVTASQPVPENVPESPAPAAPEPEDEKPTTPKASEEPVLESVEHAQNNSRSSEQESGRITQHDSEHDALSRVDTNEQVAADREFSRFDQGPLVEQPAFVPEDSPLSSASPTSENVSEKPTSRPDNGSMETTSNGHTEIPHVASASQDRWAEIRKNAADRAAQNSPPRHRSIDTERTDDGDTSGEENIDSRVARIKARVAELTGNMEAAR